MIQMWKLPVGVDIDFIKTLVGSDGRSRLYPVTDINGDWFLSNEECISPVFLELKSQYQEIVDQMVLVDFIEPARTIE